MEGERQRRVAQTVAARAQRYRKYPAIGHTILMISMAIIIIDVFGDVILIPYKEQRAAAPHRNQMSEGRRSLQPINR